MALTAEQQRLRDGKLTASAIGCLMTGETEKIVNLWRFMVGDPGYEDRDWLHFWPARLGDATEALNLEWWQHKTGRTLSRCGEVVTHPKYEWACCTLDAFDDGLIGPVDAKHVGGFETLETVRARYVPQMTWQMDCTTATKSALSIIQGAKEPVAELIDHDAGYSAELWRRAEAFMECVWTLTPPPGFVAVSAPVPAVKVIEMTGSNAWAMRAADWRDTRVAAKTFDAAAKAIKEMVPNDAARCFGHGIEVTRNRAGSLSIKEMTNA